MKQIYPFFLLLAFLVALPAVGADRAAADRDFGRKDYVGAARQYEELLERRPSAETYFNLGSAYYRQNDLPHAILNYERALRLVPSDADTRFNLALCRTKIADQFAAPSEMFFVSWARRLQRSLPADVWAGWGIGLLAFALVCFLCYYFASRMLWRQVGFWLSVLSLAAAVLCNVFAGMQAYRFRHERRAVLMQTASLTDSRSNSSKQLRELHAGTTVTVADSIGGRLRVQLPDGSYGWLDAGAVEEVVRR
ncbi:MAG: tetratricopeptide repeat protein [Alloprevotella sp.]|nr:tetratricopeptide repeat protein [Alloprevotella sp.]